MNIRFGASISGNRPSSPGPNATVETGGRAATMVSRVRGEGTQESFSFRFLPFVIRFRTTQEVFKEKQALASASRRLLLLILVDVMPNSAEPLVHILKRVTLLPLDFGTHDLVWSRPNCILKSFFLRPG
jgi:hypothetical protein